MEKKNSLEEIFASYQLINSRGWTVFLIDTPEGQDLLAEVKQFMVDKDTEIEELKAESLHNVNRALAIAKERDDAIAKAFQRESAIKYLTKHNDSANRIEGKLLKLAELTSNFPFIEYYPHSDCDMYKILNEYTKWKEEKIVLSPVSEGFEKALDIAIDYFIPVYKNFFGHDPRRA